jgi:hypothetical protein
MRPQDRETPGDWDSAAPRPPIDLDSEAAIARQLRGGRRPLRATTAILGLVLITAFGLAFGLTALRHIEATETSVSTPGPAPARDVAAAKAVKERTDQARLAAIYAPLRHAPAITGSMLDAWRTLPEEENVQPDAAAQGGPFIPIDPPVAAGNPAVPVPKSEVVLRSGNLAVQEPAPAAVVEIDIGALTRMAGVSLGLLSHDFGSALASVGTALRRQALGTADAYLAKVEAEPLAANRLLTSQPSALDGLPKAAPDDQIAWSPEQLLRLAQDSSPGAELSAGQIGQLTELGRQALDNGDIAGARLFLAKAASGGDGPALLALAQTYDQRFLDAKGVIGLKGDAAKAKAFYQQALAAGEADASQRLVGLAEP